MRRARALWVSIPSRGFWFFEGDYVLLRFDGEALGFQSPRGDFGFLKQLWLVDANRELRLQFQSPRGDFGFLKGSLFRVL